MSPAKTAEPIEMLFGGADSRGSNEGGLTSDESIRSREG